MVSVLVMMVLIWIPFSRILLQYESDRKWKILIALKRTVMLRMLQTLREKEGKAVFEGFLCTS